MSQWNLVKNMKMVGCNQPDKAKLWKGFILSQKNRHHHKEDAFSSLLISSIVNFTFGT